MQTTFDHSQMIRGAATSDVFDIQSAKTGDTVCISQRITAELVDGFAALSGDYNPLHMDADYARAAGFRDRVVHGMVAASMVSQLIGTKLPGAGSLWVEQTFRWLAPIFIGDTIKVMVTVVAKSPGMNAITVEAKAVNQNERTVMEGNGIVKLPERQTTLADISLAERSVLITGGSGEIGSAIASALAARGAKITLLYQNDASAAQTVCDRVNGAAGHAIAVEGDVLQLGSVQSAIDKARRSFGKPVDVLINTACLPFKPAPFAETGWSAIQNQFDVHVQGAFNCCQAVIPGMIEMGSGRIVNIGSTSAWGVPPLHWTGFAIAKAALKAFTRSLAVEFGPKGIRVNMVSPGTTEMDFDVELSERMRKVQAMQAPLRRLATATEISGAVLFLCSEQGEFITGADIPVCGGSTM